VWTKHPRKHFTEGTVMKALGRFSTRPLYLQVKDFLIQRVLAGDWKPGVAIPNEIELSREFRISVGTVRRALDEMEGEGLVSRRQGRGTFVIDQTSDECAGRFSNIRDADGFRVGGMFQNCEVVAAVASETEARKLQVPSGNPVFRLHRERAHLGEPFLIEDLTFPQARFPALAQDSDISTTIVVLARRYGMLLAHGEEEITVATADRQIGKVLKIAEGTPILKLEFLAYASDARPIGWRVGSCYLRDMHYRAELR
jgi:GntR family transcriptional regulator